MNIHAPNWDKQPQIVEWIVLGKELGLRLSSISPMYKKGDVLAIGKDNQLYVVVSIPCQVADFQQFQAMPCRGWMIPNIGDTVCAYVDTLNKPSQAVNVAQVGGNDGVYEAGKAIDEELAPFLPDSPFVINEHIIYV